MSNRRRLQNGRFVEGILKEVKFPARNNTSVPDNQGAAGSPARDRLGSNKVSQLLQRHPAMPAAAQRLNLAAGP